jgi:CRISPR/Cas system CMR subunit Cmr4 (Cas7 group RAMP superfamily)
MTDWRNTDETCGITRRLIITGDLELTTPTHLGNGDTEGSTDMPLLRDVLEERPLLTGTSLAGALRAYLLARVAGYCMQEQKGQTALVELLFGGAKGDEEGDQSPLIVDDSLGNPIIPEIRDGVRIDAKTRTAEDKFKYDGEFLPPGTTFPLRFELLLDDEQDAIRLTTLAHALEALEKGEIRIGARKTRGFGRCRVTGWRVALFDLRNTEQLLNWLTLDEATHPDLSLETPAKSVADWQHIFGKANLNDAREFFSISATFALAGPLLIRSEEPLTDGDHQPDFAHLRNGQGEPVISGTSLAGVLRARALRILNTLGKNQDAPDSLLNTLFGKDMQQHKEHPTASRLIVEEVVITESKPLVQNRVAIDRFTGGAFDTALFAETPQVGGEVELKFQIRNPNDGEIGLLLLLLKDLWTSDLPLGGTSSIGRGRLRGMKAELIRKCDSSEETWQIEQAGNKLIIEGDREKLEAFVKALGGGDHAQH